MFGAIWNEGPDKLCIVLEYVANGSLLDVLVPGSAGTWANPCFGYAYGTAKCMRYLHHERPKPVRVILPKESNANFLSNFIER